MTAFRTVLVGCGAMSDTWLRIVGERDDVDLVALVDLDPEASRARAERHGLACPRFTDLGGALEACDADLVLDVTVPEARHDVVKTALSAGCHVLSEKPMATSLADARDLIDAAANAERSFAIMQNRRYLAPMRALRELVSGGAIGTPGMVCADFFIGPHFGGFRDAMESPLLLDMAIHTFDQARFLTGADPVSVYCHEWNLEGSWYAGNASAVCVFELSGGVVLAYRGCWSAEGAPTSWEGAWRIVGSRGTAIWDGAEEDPYAEIALPGRGFLRPNTRSTAEGRWNGRPQHAGCIDEMLSALGEGRPAETDCRDNVKSLAMVLAAIESARTGRRVNVAELLDAR